MCNLMEFFGALDKIAPIEYSKIMIKNGDYDNSGIIVNHHDEIKKALFSLDLSEASVKRAKRLGCDTIVTHHPAIYMPIKELSVEEKSTSALLMAIASGINVISMHLNLDVAKDGIDQSLCFGLGGANCKILEYVVDDIGYGREFIVNKKISEIKAIIKKNFKTDKILVYGNKNAFINKIASFCGGGSSHALKSVKQKITDAELILTTDMPHHVIKELIEEGKSIILIPHYVSEEYGFNKFFLSITEKVKEKIQTYYFDDKRFR